MKRRYLVFGCLAVAVLTVALVVSRSTGNSASAVSLRIQAVTNDIAGHPIAVLSITKYRTVVLSFEAFATKIGDVWRWQSLPRDQMAELAPLSDSRFHIQGTRPAIASVHFPTNAPWRLRFQVTEARSGMDGLLERLRYPTGFYQKGGVLNVMFGTNPSRYHGQAYHVESEEIR